MSPVGKKPLGAVSSARTTSPDLAEIGAQFERAIERVQGSTVSLHDSAGGLLYLSAAADGAPVTQVVRFAVESFKRDQSPPILTADCGGERCAVLIRSLNSDGAFAGFVMLVVSFQCVDPSGKGLQHFIRPAVMRALEAFRDSWSASPVHSATRGGNAPVHTPSAKLTIALQRSPIAIHAQRLVPLTDGGSSVCYEILLRSRVPGAANEAPQAMLQTAVRHKLGSLIDRRVVAELVGWLMRHPPARRRERTAFSINLTADSLHEPKFAKFVESSLGRAALPPGTLSFELDTARLPGRDRDIVESARSFQRMGIPLILDNFSLTTAGFDLLRLPGVTMLKLDPELCARMRDEKLAQAEIASICQVARVLGLQTVAKQFQATGQDEWLVALGLDFVQSKVRAGPEAIDTLNAGT